MPQLFGTVLVVAFLVYCLLDVLLADKGEVRHLPKPIWLAVVVLLPLLGGAAWLVFGRPPRTGPTPGGMGPRPAPGRRPPQPGPPSGRPPGRGPSRRPRGPDDDPDFLRRLDERLRREGDDG